MVFLKTKEHNMKRLDKQWKRIIVILVSLLTIMANVDVEHLVSKNLFEVVKDVEKSTEIEAATIVRIVDGDTVIVSIEGVEEKLRLIGVDTPETVHPDQEKNTENGNLASEYTKSRLNIGQEVYLTKDKSDVDRYQRLLRFVWTEKPDNPNDEMEIRNKMYNAELLLQGFAEAKAYKPDTSMAKLFEKFYREAELNQVGLWSEK